MVEEQRIGRGRQTLPVLTPHQWAIAVISGVVFGVLCLWHLTLVITAGVPLGGLGITLRGLLTWSALAPSHSSYRADGVAAGLVFASLLVAAVLLSVPARRWWRRQRGRWDTVGFASADQAQDASGEHRARTKAGWTRRASVEAGVLDVRRAPLADVGFLLGHKHDDGQPIVLALEDQVAIIAPTGGGKTLYLMVAACLDAPGPLVTTSTKPELLDAILEARTPTGRVWVFDPLDLAHHPEPMVWDPTTGCADGEQASSRGQSFAGGLRVDDGKDGNGSFFEQAAGIIMARLLRAAAVGGKTMHDVIRWAADLASSAPEAVNILQATPGAALWGSTLETATSGTNETGQSVAMTMGHQIEPLLNDKVMARLVPAPGVAEFTAGDFVRSTDTLVIITDDQAQTNVAPLSTMLLNDVMDAAKKAAAVTATGFLDPPLRVAGDEIANVAPLPKLPGMLSDSRGIGVQLILVFQSVSQVLARWGENQGRAILGNLNCSVVLGGLQDEKALERWSGLAGHADTLQVRSNMQPGNVGAGWMVEEDEKPVLRQEEVRGLPDGVALVIYRNAPAMLVDLVPWTARPDGEETRAAIRRVRAARIRHWGGRP